MKRASAHVGRVGGLAVALGIGAAIVSGGAGSAWATPAEPSDAGTEAASPSRADSAGPTTRTRWSRPAAETGARRGEPGSTPRTTAPARPDLTPAGKTSSSAASVAIPDRVTALPSVSSTPRVPRVQAVTRAVTAAVQPIAAVATEQHSPVASQSVAPVLVAPTVAAPVMVHAPATANVDSVLSPLFGSGPSAPMESPVSWMVAAVARRQSGEPRAVAPAAFIATTALPVASVAAAAVVANKPPVILDVPLGAPNATTGAITGTVRASDPNGDRLTYRATTSTKGAVSITSTGVFIYTPTSTARHAAAKVGATTAAKTDTVTVTVTDGYGGTVPVAVSVAISPKNAVPVAGTTTVGTPDTSSSVVTGKVNATDADSDALTFSTAAKTTKGAVSLNAATGAFSYTPSEPSRAVPGTDTFTVTITDGYGGSTPVAVSVPIIGKAQQAKLTFVFNYGTGSQYWTSTAKSSLQTAANLVGSYIVVSKPVTLVFDVTAEKSPNSATLASAGSDLTSASAGFFNTVVQNKILTGVDSNGAAADGYIDVNLGIAWAFGDSVSGSQYDFVSTAMHELLHSFGFLSYVDAPGSSWNSRGTNWTKFDSFIVNKNKTKVIGTVVNRNRWNTAYNSNLTGGNAGLYFGGPNAIAVYGGPVPLYTPSPWEAGSSVTHLNDSTFTGVTTQLMNALADTGKGIRTLSAVELAIFKDLGYAVVPVPVTATALLFIGLVFLRRRPQ